MKKIAVLGAGTWGIALARILSLAGHGVTVWSALPREIEALSATHTHPNLPGMTLPEEILLTTSMEEAVTGCDVVLFAVPSVFVRSVAGQAAPYLQQGMLVVDVAKGVEPDTLLTMTGVIEDELRKHRPELKLPLCALSGPTHAEEVARDMPTSIVSACEDYAAARQVQELFRNTCLRAYTNPDVLGVELCGALKNVIALASGIAKGLGYGDNARAALITRGIVEITRLGLAMGCREQTFHGLAGVGDLIVTASSCHSRNNRAGQLMGEGKTPEEAIQQVGMVVEGVNALPAAMTLSQRYGVDMPIVRAVNAVVNQGVEPARMAAALMQRKQKAENPHTDDAPAREEDTKRLLLPVSFTEVDEAALALLRHAHAVGDVVLVALPEESLSLKPLLEAIRYVDGVVTLPADGDVEALAARLDATVFKG